MDQCGGLVSGSVLWVGGQGLGVCVVHRWSFWWLVLWVGGCSHVWEVRIFSLDSRVCPCRRRKV